MVFRLSTLSTLEKDGIDYKIGDLSLYPELLDDKKSLYIVSNNAETKLKQTLSYNGKHIIVDDATKFPESGLIRVGNKDSESVEIIYYDKRNDNTFMDLIRGFVGSQQNTWSADGKTTVGNAVMSEHHNAIKDALIKIQQNLGLKDFPNENSLNGILKKLEIKHLAPKPTFRAFPKAGQPGLKVKFQNFSNSESIRFLWDFGDGTTSSSKSPIHTYQSEGIYTVKLNMIMSTGAQGITVKNDYITISENEITPFFYENLLSSNTYEFIDQTDGDISARYWVFDDGNSVEVLNPNIHTITHTYATGNYIPSLLIVFKDQTLKRVFLKKTLVV